MTKLHPNIEMGEVKLRVSQLEHSIAFYEEIIGMRVLSRGEGMAELGAEEGKTLLVLEQIPDPSVKRPRRTTGLYHFAVLLPTRRDLGVFLKQVMDKGIEIGQADHAVSEALYISDPDGHGIEIYRDRPRSEWEYQPNGYIHMVTEPIDWRGLLHEAEGHEWHGLPAGTKIGHVHLHVNDLNAAKRFYCDQLGFDMMLDGSSGWGALFIAAGGYHHHLGLNIWAGAGAPRPPAGSPALDYYTILLPDETALQSLLDQLRRAGVEWLEAEDGWYLEDPAGNRIKLNVMNAA